MAVSSDGREHVHARLSSYHQVCQEVAETEVAAAVAGEMAH